jgi:hypothetical protein
MSIGWFGISRGSTAVSDLTPEQKLYRKLFAARKEAEAVAKHGVSESGDYSFARYEDVLAEASEKLEEQGILILPEVPEEELILGREGVLAKVVIEYTVIDTEGWGELKRRWVGTGLDKPGDKAVYKATTGTNKYFLANLLGIPFGTDPEAEPSPEVTPSESPEARRVRQEQDRAAEAPQAAPSLERELDPSVAGVPA